MAANDSIRFEVEGPAWWAYDGKKYEAGLTHEATSKKLVQAVKDAADANIGVKVVK